MRVTGSTPELDTCKGSDLRPDLSMYEKEEPSAEFFRFETEVVKNENRKVFDTANSEVNTSDGLHKAREAIHHTTGEVEKVEVVADKSEAATWLAALLPHRSPAAWVWMTAFIEVDVDMSRVPYGTTKDGKLDILSTENAKSARSRMAKYASEILLRQHRQFVYMAVICGSQAHLMRWDRAGAIATLPFDYIQEPEKLLKFVFRMAVADRSGKGYDPTTSLASAEEIALFSSHAAAPMGVQVRNVRP